MYRCEKCGGTFAQFKTPGQCPLCGVWASVKCSGCGHIAQAKEFIDNGDKCTKCGAKVPMPGGSTGCFIATAAYGSAYCDELDVLRAFRDHFLIPHQIGRWFVSVYYHIGPALARQIARHKIPKQLVFILLGPVVVICRRSLSNKPTD